MKMHALTKKQFDGISRRAVRDLGLNRRDAYMLIDEIERLWRLQSKSSYSEVTEMPASSQTAEEFVLSDDD